MKAESPAGGAVVRGTIHGRLLAYLGLLFFCAMVVLALAARAYGRQAANLSFDRLLTASILAMGETVSGSGKRPGDWEMDLPYAALEMLAMAPEDRVFYSLHSPSGELVTGYADLPEAPAALRTSTIQDNTPVFFDAIYRGEETRFAVAGHWAPGTPDQGRAWLQVGQTRRARDELAAEITRTAMLAIAVLTLAALALCWWSVGRGLAPLGRLERELAARDASNLQPIATAVPAEMAQSVGALNRFMTRLDANLDTLRLFIAEAAHQMRTPLAALRAQAQMALDEPDPVEQRCGLLAVERNAVQLTRLLNQLLADASVDHRGTLQRFEPLDLVRTVREALHEAVPRADPQPLVLFEPDIINAPLQGDALMLREAVKNIVDNALRHGVRRDARHDHAVAEIALSVKPSAVPGFAWCLCVADRGPGIAEDDLPTIFDRFARGRNAGAGGAGLGMAIVRKVMDRHGGLVTLLPRPGGGLVVQLDLPGRTTEATA